MLEETQGNESQVLEGPEIAPQEQTPETIVTQELQGEETTEESKYTPNFKFKVLDKEHEVDDFLKTSIKDADTEKKVRELYEKAYGLDAVKEDRSKLKESLTQEREKFAQTEQALQELGGHVNRGDFDSFFESLNIPKHKILEYAVELVKREQWTPEQKAAWQQSRQVQDSAKTFEMQNQELQQRQQEFAVQQRSFELSQAMTKPDVVSLAQAYDAGTGNPGAFRDFVIRIGQAHAAQGKDIPAEQAVAEAMSHLRAANPQLGMQTMPSSTSKVVQPSSKPVIPNIQGRGTTPVKSTVKSLDDIKRRAQELTAQGL